MFNSFAEIHSLSLLSRQEVGRSFEDSHVSQHSKSSFPLITIVRRTQNIMFLSIHTSKLYSSFVSLSTVLFSLPSSLPNLCFTNYTVQEKKRTMISSLIGPKTIKTPHPKPKPANYALRSAKTQPPSITNPSFINVKSFQLQLSKHLLHQSQLCEFALLGLERLSHFLCFSL